MVTRRKALPAVLAVLAALALVMLALPGAAHGRAQIATTVTGLHIVGNRLVNAQGQTVQLQGVMLSHLEDHCNADGRYTAADYPGLVAWHVNAVKIPINAHYWQGNGCNAGAYQATVESAVSVALSQGMYVLLSDLTADGAPDGDSTAMWSAVGAHYAGDTRILYETFSEPHNISGAQWQAAIQPLVDTLNRVAPHSIVLVNGPEWGGVIGQYQPTYPIHGSNLGFTVHLYDNGGNANASAWPGDFLNLAAQYPMVAAEFGAYNCNEAFLKTILPMMQAKLDGWFAWEWYNDGDLCGRPVVAANQAGTPTSYGQPIHDYYVADGIPAGQAGGAPPVVTPTPMPKPTATPTTTPTATPTPTPVGGLAAAYTCSDPHTVVAGETLASIAATIPTSVDTLAWANNLRTQAVFVGEVICLGGVQPDPNASPNADPAPPAACTYTVVAGDTLHAIAAAQHLTLAQLAALNPALTDPNLIFPGQVLNVCLGQGDAALGNALENAAQRAGNTAEIYVVQPGDTLSGIGARYGVAWPTLAAINALPNPNLIFPGQRIALSSSTPPASGTTMTTMTPGRTIVNTGAFGQCVWYVQSQRMDIQLRGNAWQLAINAAHDGYRTGTTPAIGAIAVFAPGVDGASGLGHAGIVVAISGGMMEIREMNVYGVPGGGFDRVDWRWVRWNIPGVAFIYG